MDAAQPLDAVDWTTEDGAAGDGALPLPTGRRIWLPDRGTIFVRELAGPPGAPVLVLLHGWIASAGLNWFQVFRPLAQHFRVIAPDLRGHGRGIRSWRPFRMSDCADDVAALIEHLDCGPVIAVGYSMGGLVAQLLWRRHREHVSGLVLCATAHSILPGFRERFVFNSAMSALAGTTRLGQLYTWLPSSLVRVLLPRTRTARPRTLSRWAAAEMARHDLRMILEAGVAIGSFNARRWIGEVDVPTAVVVTAQDRALGPLPQMQLALAIPGASIHRIDDGHVACANESFAEPLLGACRDVALRTAAGSRLRSVG